MSETNPLPPAKTNALQARPLQFIHHREYSREERRRNAYQARAHIIHLNRKNAPKPTSASESSSKNKHGRPLAPASPRAPKSKDTPTQAAPQDSPHLARMPASVPRTVSPTYGPLTVTNLDQGREAASFSIVAHLSEVLWPSMCGKQGSAEWLAEFFSNPAAFHSFTLQGLMHLDFLRNTTDASITESAITHKIKAITALREMIGRLPSLSRSEIETCIHITLLLARNEILPAHLSTEHVLLFVPHFPRANEIHLWGRINMIEEHANVILSLVARLGGLDGLKSQGLASLLALTDLVYASADFRCPHFPCYWRESKVGTLCEQQSFSASESHTPGLAFTNLAGSLPGRTLDVLLEVAAVSNIMARFRDTSWDNMEQLLRVRNAVLYRLITLPSWDELSGTERHGSNQSIYDICRHTAVIYSTAVLLGMPPHLGWHIRLSGKLKVMLEAMSPETWREDPPDFLIWSLFIGAVASYRSEHRAYFQKHLQQALIRRQWLAWSVVREHLHGYLWSDNACE